MGPYRLLRYYDIVNVYRATVVLNNFHDSNGISSQNPTLLGHG